MTTKQRVFTKEEAIACAKGVSCYDIYENIGKRKVRIFQDWLSDGTTVLKFILVYGKYKGATVGHAYGRKPDTT